MNNALELHELTKRYGDFCLDGVSLTLPRGCIMGLLGENGAGKSTTIKLILDLISSDAGTVAVLGQDVRGAGKEWKEDVGVALDESCFPDNLKLSDVDHIMRNIYHRWDSGIFMEYARRFSLPEGKTIKEYSHGMQMKLTIAVALSHDAKLLILDEATGGLDPMARDELLDIFREYVMDEERSILLSSHITSDLEKICDYVTLIHRGKILFTKEKDELLHRYGILKCSTAQYEGVPREAVIGSRRSEFGVVALVDRETYQGNELVERAGLEDIMLYHIKEGE